MSNGFVIYLKITILLLQNVHKQISRTLTPPITLLQIHDKRLSLPLSTFLSNSISYLHVFFFFLISGSHFLFDLSKFLQVGILFVIRKNTKHLKTNNTIVLLRMPDGLSGFLCSAKLRTREHLATQRPPPPRNLQEAQP